MRIQEPIAQRFAIQRGDVLVVRGNANADLVGRAGMVSTFPDECIYPDIAKRIVFRTDIEQRVIPEFGVLAWNHPIVHNQVLRRAKTSNGTLKINSRDVKQIVMPVPPVNEQVQLVQVTMGIDAQLDALNAVAGAQQQLKRALMSDLLTAFKQIDAVFAINDPTSIGCDLAAKQAQRKEFFIVGVDGSPDIVPFLKDPGSLIAATAAQDPYLMAQEAVKIGYDIMQGKKPKEELTLIPVGLITKENVDRYAGWSK